MNDYVITANTVDLDCLSPQMDANFKQHKNNENIVNFGSHRNIKAYNVLPGKLSRYSDWLRAGRPREREFESR
jgi:hypothetical protein